MFSTVLDFLFPSSCAGCGLMRGPLCPACGALLERPRTHMPRPAPVGMPRVWTAGTYEGVVRSALLAYKERDRRDLTCSLGHALAGAIRPLTRRGRHLSLVPVPSRRRAARQRGGDHVLRLARTAARRLETQGFPVSVERMLTVVGKPRDSSGLSADRRILNLAGALGVRLDVRPPAGDVVLVDDIVTTGATLATAARALGAHGLPVTAAVVVAATLRRSYPHGRAGGGVGRTKSGAWSGLRAAGGAGRSPPVGVGPAAGEESRARFGTNSVLLLHTVLGSTNSCSSYPWTS